MIKRLIFDIDGTLIAKVGFGKAQENILKKAKMYSEENHRKLKIALENYEENFKSYNKKDFLEHISKALNIKPSENFLDIALEECENIIIETDPRLKKLLEELSTKYEMVILSNFFEEVQTKRLEKMGIRQYFTEYYGEKLIKPNRQVYIDACKNNNPSECVMIGDNFKLDIEEPRNIGIHTIYINPKKEPVKYQDVISLEKIEDLTSKIIENIESEILV